MNALQCKLARVAAGLGIRDLASVAGVGPATISRLERGDVLKPSTLATIREALEARGVEFIDGDADGGGPGVRLRSPVSS